MKNAYYRYKYALFRGYKSITWYLVHKCDLYYTDLNSSQRGAAISAAVHKECKRLGITVVRDSFLKNDNCVYLYDVDHPDFAKVVYQVVFQKSNFLQKFSSMDKTKRDSIMNSSGEIQTELTSRQNLIENKDRLERELNLRGVQVD